MKAYEAQKRKAFLLRAAFLRDRLDHAPNKRAQREIIRNEEVRRSWRVVNKGRGIQKLHSVSKVEVQHGPNLVLLTEQQVIEDAIMLSNSKRFRLASSTPLMQPAAVEN